MGASCGEQHKGVYRERQQAHGHAARRATGHPLGTALTLDDARRSNGAAGVWLGRLRPLRHAQRMGDGEIFLKVSCNEDVPI